MCIHYYWILLLPKQYRIAQYSSVISSIAFDDQYLSLYCGAIMRMYLNGAEASSTIRVLGFSNPTLIQIHMLKLFKQVCECDAQLGRRRIEDEMRSTLQIICKKGVFNYAHASNLADAGS